MYRRLMGSLLAVMGACGCADPPTPDPPTPETEVTTAFSRWNEKALRGDSTAALLVCEGVPNPDPAYFSMVTAQHQGYERPADMQVTVSSSTSAVIYFSSESDEMAQDVNVTLEKQEGVWKVCVEQATAPGGFG
jgi:hypothetical protein